MKTSSPIVSPLRLLLAASILSTIAGTPAQGQTLKPMAISSDGCRPENNALSKPCNSLTIGIPSFFDGFTAISYERLLNDRFTIAASAGVTYNSYFMQAREQKRRDEAYTGGNLRTGPNSFDVEEEFENRFFHEARPGIYLAITPKRYFKRRALNGMYCAPVIEFRDYRFRTFKGNETVFFAPYLMALTEQSVQRVREEVSENVRCIDASAILGGHFQMRSHLVIAYHIGAGIRSSWSLRQNFGIEHLGDNYFRFTNDIARNSETRWVANFGFSVGGFW